MRAGSLDRRVELQRYTSTTDPASGERVEAWGPLATVWASWRRATARETLAAAELSAVVSDVFEIRYGSEWADLNAKDRLVFGSVTHQIVGVDPIGRREGLRISTIARGD